MSCFDIGNLLHVALIADGNRRWAAERGKVSFYGHKAGYDTVKSIVTTAKEIGLKYLTLFCFSTENQKRSDEEKSYLFDLFESAIKENIETFKKNNIKIKFIGDLSYFSQSIRKIALDAEEITSDCDSMTFVMALNYGGRLDIVNATRKIALKIKKGIVDVEDIDDEYFASNLYTAGIPDPDIIIRTGGDSRISNFLLWQMAYSELFFVDKFFPSFSKEDFLSIISEFSSRKRRFGK